MCIQCGYRVALHFAGSRKLACSEVAIRQTGKIPKFKSCAHALRAYVKVKGKRQ